MAHMSAQPSLSAAQGLIRERLITHVPLDEPEIELMQQALATAAKRFAALANVEERHANHYRAALAKLQGA